MPAREYSLTCRMISENGFRICFFICVKINPLRILLFDNHDSFTYNIVEALRRLGIRDLTVMSNDDATPDRCTAFDGLIFSPGPDLPAVSGHLLAVIRALASTHPMLGICLGHQAIAEAFGARLKPLAHPLHGQVTEFIQTAPDPLLGGMVDKRVGLYHSWIVDDDHFPPELEVTARAREGHILALRHRRLPVYGVQFHPESYMSPAGDRLLECFLRLL